MIQPWMIQPKSRTQIDIHVGIRTKMCHVIVFEHDLQEIHYDSANKLWHICL